jgi:ParB/RepB/Spo0J family partition protein
MGRKKSAAVAAEMVDEPIVVDTSEEPVRFAEEQDEVPVDSLRSSPLQYRTVFDATKLTELASSIRRLGVMSRIIVRDTITGDEIIAGERRWRAARLAGLETVPVTRLLDVPDDVVCEMQVIENSQREDPHPLEDCHGFMRLRDQFGRTPEQIAAKIHRPPTYVYQRLQLEHLGEPAQKAMREGVSFGVGLELARVRDPARQATATKELLEQAKSLGDVITIARARAHIRQRYMLRLVGAPFDAADETLPGGACSGCPKHTGNQGALFGDADALGKEALCTDASCFDGKRDAVWKRKAAEAETVGKTVATAKLAKEIFPTQYTERPEKAYVDLEQTDYNTGSRTWRAILGKKRIVHVPITIVRDPAGNPREIALRADVLKAIKKDPSPKDPESFRPKEKTPADDAEREARKLEKIVGEELPIVIAQQVGAAVEACSGKVQRLFWAAIARHLIESESSTAILDQIVRARGLATEDAATGAKLDASEVLEREVAFVDAVALGALIGQLVALGCLSAESHNGVLEALEVDGKDLRRQVTKAAKASLAAKEKAAAASPKKPKSRKEIDQEEAEERREREEDVGYDD